MKQLLLILLLLPMLGLGQSKKDQIIRLNVIADSLEIKVHDLQKSLISISEINEQVISENNAFKNKIDSQKEAISKAEEKQNQLLGQIKELQLENDKARELLSRITDSLQGNLTDKRDGNTYKTVKIGNQVWMSENLAYKPSTGNYWASDDDNSNVAKYGYLYDWETARNVCPSGWHLPSDEEWTTLIDYLGGKDVAGGKMKAVGTIEAGTGLWYDPNDGATNESGFSGLPGGHRYNFGTYASFGSIGYWWSATQYSATSAWNRYLGYYNAQVSRYNDSKLYGFSVRCVRD